MTYHKSSIITRAWLILVTALVASMYLTATSSAARGATPYDPGSVIDWSGARWLKATDTPADGGTLSTIIDIDLTIEKGSPAVIFGWTADRAYFQWQILTESANGVLLRRCVRTFTDDPPHEDVEIPGVQPQDVIGMPINLRIETAGNYVTTYLNNKEIDTYKCSRPVLSGKSGFRVVSGDELAVDNFDMTFSHPNGQTRQIVSEDFGGNKSLYFLDADPCDGQWHITGKQTEQKLLTVDESYPTFYRFFKTKPGISSATLYTSALGIYDVWVNGQRVGTRTEDGACTYDELKPGWTDYNKRVACSIYDVTALCQAGENSIGAIVTPGWTMGQIARNLYKYPIEMAFIAKLEVAYTDGSKDVIVTDEEWSVEKYSHILKSDIYHGEIVDGRRLTPWTDRASAMPCKPLLYDYPGAVEEWCGPTVRKVQDLTLRPVKAMVYADVNHTTDYGVTVELYSTDGSSPIRLKYGETAIVDFGQNCAGVPKIKVKGDRGTRVHLRFGEALNDTGERSHGNDGPAGSLYTANLRAAKAELYYVLRGDEDGESYTPATTYYGYRYCEVTTTDDILIESVESCPLSSSHELTGSVETDNDDVNRLFSNILWSQLSNFVSVPTDCPQRDERLGWTADAQLFATTAMYNANVGDFYRKWLRDLRDAQRDDGAYPDVAPLSLVNYGSAGWSDAGIVVPWQVYIMTGDKTAVAEHYASMERYMSWLSTLKADGLQYPGAYATYGDLFAPHAADKRFVSQAYYYYDAVLMAKMSQLLSQAPNDSYDKNAASYQALSADIKREIQSRYFDECGLKNSTQSACVISLWFGLYADEGQQQGIADTLPMLIAANGYKLDTGFISSAYVLQVLCEYGHDDVAYELLTQHDYPSWMYMVDMGATTMWENWYCYRPESGFCDVQRNSFNHFGLGSFGSWMYSHMCGIMPCEDQPGFERVIFAPCVDLRESCHPNRKVNRAKAVKQTPNGNISAQWSQDDDVLTYDIYIPEGVEGEVRMPVPSPDAEVYAGAVPITQSDSIQPLGYRNGRKIYSVKSGEYHFSTALKQTHIQSPVSEGLSIWPNPASSVLNIACGDEIQGVNIISLSGEVVSQHPSGVSAVDVSSLPAGFYLASIITPQGSHIKRFVKK